MITSDTTTPDIGILHDVRRHPSVVQALGELQEKIAAAIAVTTAALHDTQGFKWYEPKQVIAALTDRELATLELWAGTDDQVIHDECERRQTQYEEFTRRYAPPAKTEPAE